MTTGFRTEHWSLNNDLDELFAPGDSGADTGFISFYRNADLGRIFAPLSQGSHIAQPWTGFTALDGRDLSEWFAAAGTVFPEWPLGGGFDISVGGFGVQFATDTITVGCGRGTHHIGLDANHNAFDGAMLGMIANRFVTCPGQTGTAFNSFNSLNGFVRGTRYRIPASASFAALGIASGLGGNSSASFGPNGDTGWVPVHNGGIAFCDGGATVESSQDIFNFVPSPNTFYGSTRARLIWTNTNVWELQVGAGFVINNANMASLNGFTLRVYRVS